MKTKKLNLKDNDVETINFTVASVKPKDLPVYVTVNGVQYEKITSKTVKLRFHLDPKVKSALTKKLKEGLYVNEQELLRDAIRAMVKKHGL